MKKLILLMALVLTAIPLAAQSTTVSGVINATSTNCATVNSCIVLPLPLNTGAVGIQLDGTFSGTLSFEGVINNATYGALTCSPLEGGSPVASATAVGRWQCPVTGAVSVRVRGSATMTGAANVAIVASSPSPSGSNTFTGDITIPGDITVTSSALPTGASTSAKQDTGNSSLSTIATNTTGASTASKQDTGNASLATIATNTTGTKDVACVSGCTGGTTDTDDGSVAGGQSTGLAIGLDYMWNGSAWVRNIGNATDGQTVNLGANNDVTVSNVPHVVCDSGCSGSGGTALADGGTFTAGSTSDTPIAGFYQSSPTTCATGKACAVGMTTDRELKTYVANIAADAAVGDAVTTNPVQTGGTFETSPTSISSGDAAVNHYTATQQLIVTGAGGTFPVTNAGTFVAQAQGAGSAGSATFLRCDSSVVYDDNTNGKTQLVALSSSKKVYVCGVSLAQSTTSAVTVSLGSGTGSDCGTTYTAKTPAWVLAGPASAALQGMILGNSAVPWFSTDTSEELCISTNAAVAVQLLVTYAQY